MGIKVARYKSNLELEDLPTVWRLKIKRSPIRATIINKSGDSFVKYEMFKRLNTGGSLLSAQEIRNCSSRMIAGGDLFYESIQRLADNPSFRRTIAKLSPNNIEKRGDEELVLRFFAVTSYRDLFKGNIGEWLDAVMEDILFERRDFDIDKKSTEFEYIFQLIDDKLGGDGFTRFNDHGEATGHLAPAYFEAVVCAFFDHADTLAKLPAQTIRERLIQAFSNEKFKHASGPGANTSGKLEMRVAVVADFLVNNGAAG